MNEDGTLSFGTVIDTSGYDEGIKHIEDGMAQVGANIEAESSKISEVLNNLPNPNIDITSATQSLDTIKAAWEQMDNVADSNTSAIKILEAEYKRLGDLASKSYNKATADGDKEYSSIKQKQQAIQALISERKKVLSELDKTSAALVEAETRMTKEKEATEKTANAQVSLRQRLREMKISLFEMEAAGQIGTAEYRNLQEETAKLTDAWGDAQSQANILAHDQRGMQGLISGISGVSGAFTAAQGAVSLFAGENEDLQKVMLKVQSLMAITMGLQQVQQMLNKDSAFSLVTLNGIKEWWNSLLAVGIGLEEADAVATAANTTANAADAVASGAEAAAKSAASEASGSKAVAEVVDTAATGANATAAAAGTVANIGLAGAFRMVGVAIKSIPVFGWIAAAIGILIGVISHFVDKANEADKELEDHEKMLEDARKTYVKASTEIQDYTRKIEKFNGTKAQEKKLIDELNSKYGEAMGYYKSLAEWKDALKKKGADYCEMLLKEAEAQAILTKVTEAYVNLQTVKDKAAAGEYDHWYNTKSGDEASRKEAITEAQKSYDNWKKQYETLQTDILNYKSTHDLGMHIDPSSSKSGKDSGTTFDAAKAALEAKKAQDSFTEARKKYIKESEQAIAKAQVDAMAESQAKEINQIAMNTFEQQEAWRDKLNQLANVKKNAEKDVYMSKKGATEVGWEKSDSGKKSIAEYKAELLQEQAVKEEYEKGLATITERGEKQMADVRKKYRDALINEYGTEEQKYEQLQLEWMQRLATMPQEFIGEASKKMDEDFSKLATESFKKSIDWDSVFGNLDEQSLHSLQYSLDKVKTYFDSNKANMSGTEIKDFQDAISKMEDEIASRNPFYAFHRSIEKITSSKEELVNAMNEWKETQNALTEAQNQYNEAKRIEKELETEVQEGKLSADSDKYKTAVDNVTASKVKLNQATENNNKAEQRTLKARNGLTSSYKGFSNQLNAVGSVIQNVGGKAKNLASVFRSDVANGMEKALDCVDEVLDATSSVISAIGDVGKGVAKGVESTVEATSLGVTASAAAGAAAMSTIEKASVILAVISAALQVATAIANLFNNDDDKQKEIENLQSRIDQLQWELDNSEAVRLQNKVGDAVERLKQILKETTLEVENLHKAEFDNASVSQKLKLNNIYQADILKQSVEKIADAYAKVDYTADKALGGNKYKEARAQMENLAEQQILIQKQINEEQSKKETDNGKIDEWNQKIRELSEQMDTVINDMLEDILGSSSEDMAKQLGDAFIEACKTGEDAMEAWKNKANEIIQEVLKKMMVEKFLEEPLGVIFNKYKNKWFVKDAEFSIDTVIDSMDEFSNDLNQVGEGFQQIWSELPNNIKKWFTDDAEREGTQKGIATASQDSVDENNARLTTIQGHTYTLVQGMGELNATSNQMLERLTGIEHNTSQTNTKLDDMNNRVKSIKDTVDDISLTGLKIKS